MSSTNTSAVQAVFEITELLKHILVFGPFEDILQLHALGGR